MMLVVPNTVTHSDENREGRNVPHKVTRKELKVLKGNINDNQRSNTKLPRRSCTSRHPTLFPPSPHSTSGGITSTYPSVIQHFSISIGSPPSAHIPNLYITPFSTRAQKNAGLSASNAIKRHSKLITTKITPESFNVI